MTGQLEASIVRVLDAAGAVAGTGFLVSQPAAGAWRVGLTPGRARASNLSCGGLLRSVRGLGDWGPRGTGALAELGDGEGAEAGVAGDVVGGAAEGDGLA